MKITPITPVSTFKPKVAYSIANTKNTESNNNYETYDLIIYNREGKLVEFSPYPLIFEQTAQQKFNNFNWTIGYATQYNIFDNKNKSPW